MSLLLLLFIHSLGLQCSCSHSHNSTGTCLPLHSFPDAAIADRRDQIVGPIAKDHVHLEPNFNPRSWPPWP